MNNNENRKNMVFNFKILKNRVIDAFNNTDLVYIRNKLGLLEGPTIFSGVGGSSVVSEFGAKVVNKKNGVVTINSEPRDFIYKNNEGFKNVVVCSYSGNNYGVELSFRNDMNKFLLSNKSFDDINVTYLKYSTSIKKERSFISLGASLIPISILMDYYLDGNNDVFIDCIKEYNYNFNANNDIYEIFTGYDTCCASKYLESTMVESGIGIPIIHDKYSYCHGRSTIGVNYESNLIYFYRNTDFDRMVIDELYKYYKEIIVIDSEYDEHVLVDYQMLIKCMYLTKYIAENKSIDLSDIKYSPIVKKLYKYNGNI